MLARARLGQQQDRHITLRQFPDYGLDGSHAGANALYERSRRLAWNILSLSGVCIRQIFAHFCPFCYMAEAPMISYLYPKQGNCRIDAFGLKSAH